MFRWLSKASVLTKNEFGRDEIKIPQGVVLSTPSPTHLTGLPPQGSRLKSSYPSTYSKCSSHPSTRGGARKPAWFA